MAKSKIEHHSAIEILDELVNNESKTGQPLIIPVDEGLNIDDVDKDLEERKNNLIKELKDNIDESLKKLRERKKDDVDGFVFEEKIRLLEQTKKAVDAFLLQILSSPSISTKSIEVLSLIVKVNADILKDISDPDFVKSITQPNDSQQSNTQVIIAPSESMLSSLKNAIHGKK